MTCNTTAGMCARNHTTVKIKCLLYFTFVYRLYHLGHCGLSAARRNAWAGGMLYRDSVSSTPLIQVFRGRPLALRPLNLVLYAR